MKKTILYLLSLTLVINTILGGCVYNPNKNDGFLPVLNKNETILQAFYWEMGEADYPEEEKNLWCLLVQKAPELSEVGFTGVWLPPANKAMGGKKDVGYATYDL
ncbi:MAG: alpha-amylase, partial [Defluviitoga tunisiensis]